MKLKNIHMYFNVVNVKCEFYLSFAKRATEVYIARFTRKTHQNDYRDNGFFYCNGRVNKCHFVNFVFALKLKLSRS